MVNVFEKDTTLESAVFFFFCSKNQKEREPSARERLLKAKAGVNTLCPSTAIQHDHSQMTQCHSTSFLKTERFNLFTTTGRIYMSQKWPSQWQRMYIYMYVQLQFRFYAAMVCQSPTTNVVVVACLRGVFFVSSLITPCSLGSCSLRKQSIYASPGFCPNGGKQRCGCFQVQHKLVWAVRLMAFVTAVIEERSGFVWLKARETGMTVEIGRERKLVTGWPGGRKWPHCSQNCYERRPILFQLVNARLCRGTVGTKFKRIFTSEALWVSCQELEKFKAGALRQSW